MPAIQTQERVTLERVMTFRDYVAIGFGVMIGVGWVVYAGHWLETGGSLGAVLGFMIGGACLIPVGKCYGELTAAMPVSGGAVAFNYKAFGPFASFLTAWMLSLNYIAVVPFETIAAGAMLEAMFPGLTTEELYRIGDYRISWSTIIPGILAAVWIIHLSWRGAKGSARFQIIVLVAKLAAALAFSAVAFWKGDWENLRPLFVGNAKWWLAAPPSIASVLVIVPFFMAGFDCIPQAAEEAGLKMKPRQLGTAITTTIVIGAAFYILIVLALGCSVPGTVLREIVQERDKLAMAEVFRRSFGYEWAAKLVLFTALMGVFSTLNGMFITSTRLLFAQGRGGLLPPWFARLHPQNRTPKNAIIVVGALAILAPFVGKAGLLYIVNCSSFIFVLVISSVVLATIRLRKVAPHLERPYRINTATIWLAVLVCAFLLGLMILPGSPGQIGCEETIALSIWIFIGVGLYFGRERGMSATTQGKMILGKY